MSDTTSFTKSKGSQPKNPIIIARNFYFSLLKTQFDISEKYTLSAPFLILLLITCFLQQISLLYQLPRDTTFYPGFNWFFVEVLKYSRFHFLDATFLFGIQGILLACNCLLIICIFLSHWFRIYKPQSNLFTKSFSDVVCYYFSDIFFWVGIIPSGEIWLTGILVHCGHSNLNISGSFQGETKLPLAIAGLVTTLLVAEFHTIFTPAKIYFNSSNGNAARRVRSHLEMAMTQIRGLMVFLRIMTDYYAISDVYVLIFVFLISIVYWIDFVLYGKFQGRLESLYGFLVCYLLLNSVFETLALCKVFPKFVLRDKYFIIINFLTAPLLLKLYLNLKPFLYNITFGKGLLAKKNIKYESIDCYLRRAQSLLAYNSMSLTNGFQLSSLIVSIVNDFLRDATAREDLLSFLSKKGLDGMEVEREIIKNHTLLQDFIMFLYYRLIKQGFSRRHQSDRPPVTFLSSYIAYAFFEANKWQQALKHAYYFAGRLTPNTIESLIMHEIIRALRDHQLTHLEADQKQFHKTVYVDVFELEERHEALRTELEAIRAHYIKFYSLVGSSVIDLNELYASGVQVQTELNNVEQEFERLYQTRPDNLDLVYDYANFLSKVKLAPLKQYKFLLIKSEELMHRKMALRKTMSGYVNIGDFIEASNRYVVVVDADKECGKIIKATQALGNLFGRPKHQLEGQNISVLLPPFLHKCHEGAIDEFINNDKVNNISDRQKKALYGLTNDKLLISVQAFLKPELFGNRLCITGLMHERRKTITTGILLTDLDGKILNYNRELTNIVEITDEIPTLEEHCMWLMAPKLISRYYPNFKVAESPAAWRTRSAVMSNLSIKAEIIGKVETEEELRDEKEQWKSPSMEFEGAELIKIYFFKHPRMNEEFFKKFMKIIVSRFVAKNRLPRLTTGGEMSYLEIEDFKRNFKRAPIDFSYEECEIYLMRVSLSSLDYFKGRAKLKQVEVFSYRKLTQQFRRDQIFSLKKVQDVGFAINEIVRELWEECGLVYRDKTRKTTVARNLAKEQTNTSLYDGLSLDITTPKSTDDFSRNLLYFSQQVAKAEKRTLLRAGTRLQEMKPVDAEDKGSDRQNEDNNSNEDMASRMNDGRNSSMNLSSMLEIPEEVIHPNIHSFSNMTAQNEIRTETFREGLLKLRDGLQRNPETDRDWLPSTHRGLLTAREGYETPRENNWKITTDDGSPTQPPKLDKSHQPQGISQAERPETIANYQNIIHQSHLKLMSPSAKQTPNGSFSAEVSVDQPLIRYLDRLRSPKGQNEIPGGHGFDQRITEQEDDYEEGNEHRRYTVPPKVLIQRPDPVSRLPSRTMPQRGIIVSQRALRQVSFEESQAELRSKSDNYFHSSGNEFSIPKNDFFRRAFYEGANFSGKFVHAFEKLKSNTDVNRGQIQQIDKPMIQLIPGDADGVSSRGSQSSHTSFHISEVIFEKKLPKSVIRYQYFGLISYLVVIAVIFGVAFELRYVFNQLTDMMRAIMDPLQMTVEINLAMKEASMISLVNEGRYLSANQTIADAYIDRVSSEMLGNYNNIKGNLSQFMINAFRNTVLEKQSLVQEVAVNIPDSDTFNTTNLQFFTYILFELSTMVSKVSAINNANYAFRVMRSNIAQVTDALYNIILPLSQDIKNTQTQSRVLAMATFGTVLGVGFIIAALVVLIYRRILSLKEKILCLFCTISKESMQKEIQRLSRSIDMIFNIDDLGRPEHRRRTLAQIREGKRAISRFRHLKRPYGRVIAALICFYGVIVIYFTILTVVTVDSINHTVEVYQDIVEIGPISFFLGNAVGTISAAISTDMKNITELQGLIAESSYALATIHNQSAGFTAFLTKLSDPASSSLFTKKGRVEMLGMVSGDFCPHVTSSPEELSLCQSLAKHSSQTGIWSAGLGCVNFYRGLLMKLVAANLNVNAIAPIIESQEFHEFEQMVKYVIEALNVMTYKISINVERLCTALERAQISNMAVGAIFFAVLFILSWGWFIYSMSKIIQNAKLLLGLIPRDILNSNVYIKAFFRKGI